MKTLFGNTLIVIVGGWLLLGCASEVQRAPDDSPSTSSVAPDDAPKTPAGYLNDCAGGDVKACSELIKMGGGNAAVEPLRKACQAGERYGCNALALILTGLRSLCDEKGHLKSCANLGVHLMEFSALPFGRGSALGPANVPEAEALLNKACDGGEMLGCTSLGVLPIDLCINLPDEEGWCLGAANQIETAMTTIAEFVHDDETLENWTEMIEVTSMSSRSPVVERLGGLDAFIKLTDDAAATTCEDGWDLKVVDEEPISGLPVRVFVTRCERLSRTAHTHESVWGTSETKVQLMIEGRQNLYNVIRTKRGSDLDERSVNEWITFLKNVRLCDTPIPVQLCKSYESGPDRTGDAQSDILVAGFEAAFSVEGYARLSKEIESDKFRGAIERGDLKAFCGSFGRVMDAAYRKPWRLAEVYPFAPHRGCAAIKRPPDIYFMCCPCKYPGPVHKVCTSKVK